MLKRHVTSFEISRYQYLNCDGLPIKAAITPEQLSLTDDEIVTGYKLMRLARAFTARALKLKASTNSSERVWVYAPSPLEEAALVGMGLAMQRDDVFVPSYRAEAARLGRGSVYGIPLEEVLHGTLQFWGGDERGHTTGVVPHDLPFAISVASQIPHAVGIAKKFQLLHMPRVALTEFGDGASSNGNFYTGENLAGVWNAPVVFVIRNNGYAISIKTQGQTAAKTLAQKAIAAGIPGEQVDGNDLIAVMARVRAALTHAREGNGPTLIELQTYRGDNHTTSDDWHRYRDSAEVEAEWKKDPIPRLRKYLRLRGLVLESDETVIDEWIADIIEKAVRLHREDMMNTLPQSDMLRFLFEEIPPGLRSLDTELKTRAGGVS